MNIRLSRVGAAALGLALVAGAGGVAVAADQLDWYTGSNATQTDPDNIAGLKIVDASGATITHGDTDTPLGAFAVADSTVRPGDTSATLFVNLPSTSTAPAGWSGQQNSGTTTFSGGNAATGPAGSSGKPFVKLADALPLEQAVAAYPNDETAASFAGVYELRLRTGSSTGGVSTEYASAYVKVTGDTWKITDAPELGDTAPVAATITATWPASLKYGTAGTVSVTVKGGDRNATGSVTLTTGAKTLATGTLSSGAAKLTIGKTALAPGKQTLTVSYAGDDHVKAGTVSKAYTVAKTAPSKVAYKTTTKPTSKKSGKATVTVSVPSGLAKATGKVGLVITKGKTTKKVTGKVLKSGKVTITLPKLAKGTWTVKAKYAGDARYSAKSSASAKIKITK